MTSLVDSVEKVDDATVVFKLPKPYSPLLANLAIPIFGIVSPTAIEKYGLDVSVNPSGTGAFSLASPDDWVRDSQISLTANPNYFLGAPAVEKVILKIAPESSIRLQQVESGEIDVAIFLTPDDVNKAQDNSDLQVLEVAGLNTNYVEFNVTKDPFTSKEVRQALNYAVNKEELSQGLYAGGMVPAGGVLPPSDWAYNPDLKGYPFDLDKAKELLTTAGYGDSNPLKFTLMVYTIPRGYNPAADRLGTAIQEYWKTGRRRGGNPDRRVDAVPGRPPRQHVPGFAQWLDGRQRRSGQLPLCIARETERGRLQYELVRQPGCRKAARTGARGDRSGGAHPLYHQAEQTDRRRRPLGIPRLSEAPGRCPDERQQSDLQPTYIYYLSAVSKA